MNLNHHNNVVVIGHADGCDSEVRHFKNTTGPQAEADFRAWVSEDTDAEVYVDHILVSASPILLWGSE